MYFLSNQIKKEILEFIKKNNGAFYGDIVMYFGYSKNKVLKNLLDLKDEGQIYKDDDGGKFKIV